MTWTVFWYLEHKGLIAKAVFRTLGLESLVTSQKEPTMLLWGVPWRESPAATKLQSGVINILDDLNERPRSEPDIILDFGTSGLVIIEAKYHSDNSELKEHELYKFDRYLGQNFFLDCERVRSTRLYELARNWRIGCELAKGRSFWLLNLLSREKKDKRLDDFSASLRKSEPGSTPAIETENSNTSEEKPECVKLTSDSASDSGCIEMTRFFERKTWRTLLGNIPRDPWFDRFVTERELMVPSDAAVRAQ
ncbi:MAG: hypothetical protein WA188_15250 [Terriglobales bacterium]